MSTKDQILSSELHGEALLTARRPELQPLIDHLREVALGRDDIRAECAGTIAGSWFASGVRQGEELIAAGLLMLAKKCRQHQTPSPTHSVWRGRTLFARQQRAAPEDSRFAKGSRLIRPVLDGMKYRPLRVGQRMLQHRLSTRPGSLASRQHRSSRRNPDR